MCHWPVSHSQTGRNNVVFLSGISPRASCNTQCTVDTPDEWRDISAIWENISIAYHSSSKLFFFFFWLTLQTNFEATWKQTVTWIIMFTSSRSPFWSSFARGNFLEVYCPSVGTWRKKEEIQEERLILMLMIQDWSYWLMVIICYVVLMLKEIV